MCGNFGLILLRQAQFQVENQIKSSSFHLDDSVHESMQRVASTHGLRVASTHGQESNELESICNSSVPALLDVIDILESQTANTELRGGQAGGFSSIQYPMDDSKPLHKRVRCVARKRYPLSRDLASMYKKEVKSSTQQSNDIVSVIGHTRFATSSINIVEELHPHQWSPLTAELMWRFNSKSRTFEKSAVICGLHLTHNGDFNQLTMYGETVTVNDVGLWLEKVLHQSNLLNGDSPKLAGCMELFHVQGRWSRATRLAWVRVILKTSRDVCNGALSRDLPSIFPNDHFWNTWADFFDSVWIRHINNIIIKNPQNDGTYSIDRKAEKLMVQDIVGILDYTGLREDETVVGMENKRRLELNCHNWCRSTIQSFVTVAIRGFLRGDLYTALTEVLSRAEGSFGVQVHSPCEPGVVVIASKGQPMSIAFDSNIPIILFGSEATALTISVTKSGQWLRSRIDLDSQGEVMRLGRPKQLLEGSFIESKNKSNTLLLATGIEIRSYSLIEATESLDIARVIPVVSVPLVLEPGIDHVEADLVAIPTVVSAIDSAWGNKYSKSAEKRTSSAFCSALIESMKHRLRHNQNTFDLIITGVEVSLWMGEQFANDLKTIFPQVAVCVISANKMLGLGHSLPHKVFFAGSCTDLEHQIDRQNTICLLISQSGQTFPTLHAAFSFASFVENDKVFLLTGTFNSKIENVIVGECFKKKGTPYVYNRVFNNYSGHRPAEPSSVAAVSTWHTLSHILLNLVENVRNTDGEIVMLLSSGCIGDLRSLMLENVVKNLQNITQKGEKTHSELIYQGKLWGAHITEQWTILVFVGLYILISVGLGLPIMGLLGDAVVGIIRAGGGLANTTNYKLIFSLRYPAHLYSQPWSWSLIGAILQIADGLWFVFLAKVFTWGHRWYENRAIYARFGKRCILIVDQPVVHQMLENFVSKLYSQAYSFVTPEIHGACGVDHMVHRFTHRVVRGLLIAVGRPDGRLGCLSKSENAIILATKQAAFIRNPAYAGFEGSGPEIVTISHNPFIPSFKGTHIIINSKRRKFLEEVLYEKLHMDATPFTLGILRNIAEELQDGEPQPQSEPTRDPLDETNRGTLFISSILPNNISTQSLIKLQSSRIKNIEHQQHQQQQRSLPLGSHFISADIGASAHGSLSGSLHGLGLRSIHGSIEGSSHGRIGSSMHGPGSDSSATDEMIDFFYNARQTRRARKYMSADLQTSLNTLDDKPISNDPHARLIFSERMDTTTREIVDQEHIIQSFYECRIAALERFTSFCVLFHAMAQYTSNPLLMMPFDTSRSQSYLRVATTASPVAAVESAASLMSPETDKIARIILVKLKNVKVNF